MPSVLVALTVRPGTWDLSYSGARSVVLWSLLGPFSNEQSSQFQTSVVYGQSSIPTMRDQLWEEMVFLNE